MKNRCVALLLVLSVLAGASPARQIHVDDDGPGDPLPFDRQVGDRNEDGSAEHPFDGIQEAIDAAVDGDTIIVAPGHYVSPDPWIYDEIDFKGKNIRLIGSAPTDFSVAEQTVLCGVVVFQGTEDPNCLLQGFKIQNHGHGGILGNETHAVISHCIISGNGPCGATVVRDVHGQISNCLIVDNTTFHDCGVLPVVSGCLRIVNCTIANNLSGVSVVEGMTGTNRTTIAHSIIYGNEGQQLIYLPQVPVSGVSRRSSWTMGHCLIGGWNDSGFSDGSFTAIWDADPCFVQPGAWAGETLREGDYHLKSEGWRWSPRALHGSHWYYDAATSPAVDAGDPILGLGEELERTPDDPEGQCGINRALNLGAYGGTAQASLAPNKGATPGVGTVDLEDYWPWAARNSWSASVAGGTPSSRSLTVERFLNVDGFEVCMFRDSSTLWWRNVYGVYVDHILYKTESAAAVNLLPQLSEALQVQYPQFLTVGATVQVPDDPFGIGTLPGRPATVVRGALADVLAGTAFDPNQFISGTWPDVIAFRENAADGTLGEPIAMFARGLGPLMLGGQPVHYACVDNRTFRPSGSAYVGPPARR